MRARLRFILALALLPIYWIAAPISPAIASTGDSDTYFNLEANTSSSHRYAIMTNDSSVQFTSAFSFEMWMKPTNSCSGIYCTFIVKEEVYAFAIVNGNYQFALNGTSGGWVWQDTTIPAQINSWQHFAMTHAANTNLVSMYLNGLLVYTGPADHLSTLNFYNPATSFQVGARVGNSNSLTQPGVQSYIGSIDEIKMWQTTRTQAQVQSDMHTYGPTNDSNLKAYYDFNDISGSTILNKAVGGGGTLTMKNSPTISDLEISTVSSGTKVVKFPRTYLSANGWKPPLGISSLNALVVGGGGGGGNNVGNGGGGGGGYLINNLSVSDSTNFAIKVGTGGAGGRNAAAGNITYDGTTLMDGQSGESSVATVNGTSFTGAAGGGGDTIWSTNLCGSSGAVSLGGTSGSGSGSSGTSFSGGAGGALSGTQSVANGVTGFSSSITGSSAFYGSGGGAGGWSGYVAGSGANSQGGTGNGSASTIDGLNQTGSGGGGNAAGCAVGGKGGSGVVIFAFNASGALPSAISSAIFRTATSLTVTVSEAGKVTFYAQGKVIPGCKARPTITSASITATCSWRPSQRTAVPITAKFAPTSLPSNLITINFGTVQVASRTGKR
jgi:hypothetical protein